MRLYVNENEIETLKLALTTLNRVIPPPTPEHIAKATSLLERVELCEMLQKNCRRAKEGSENE